jgi:pimeloyl-ACP methyl ester carboxylesterase
MDSTIAVSSPAAVRREIAGLDLEVYEFGEGPDLLYLHGSGGLQNDEPQYLMGLAERFRITAPVHPGFGHSERPAAFDTVDDLVFFYGHALRELDLHDPVVVGHSFGGWIAAELACRCPELVARLVLVDAVGIRMGAPTDRPIADVFGMSSEELLAATYARPESHRVDMTRWTDDDFYVAARNLEALALYTWEPYMHNRKLVTRLRHVTAPTLVIWGEQDGIVSPEYGQAYADSIPGAQLVVVADAGHLPHVEQTAAFTDEVVSFCSSD